jgi:hypothetical protein
MLKTGETGGRTEIPMNQSKSDDPNLAEVKAILGRLQRISRKPRGGSVQTGENEPLLTQPDGRAVAPEDDGPVPQPAWTTALANAPWLVKAAAFLAVPVLATVGGVVMFAGGYREAATVNELSPQNVADANVAAKPVEDIKPAVSQKPDPDDERKKSPVLDVAQQLMSKGQVRAARTELRRAMRDDSADIAWALARSYDPNVVVGVPAADAGPDVAEATRWYRIWYDIAIKQGMVSDSVSLERIIRSMN